MASNVFEIVAWRWLWRVALDHRWLWRVALDQPRNGPSNRGLVREREGVKGDWAVVTDCRHLATATSTSRSQLVHRLDIKLNLKLG